MDKPGCVSLVAGQVSILMIGVFSDKRNLLVARAKLDFSMSEQIERWRSETGGSGYEDGFVAWLLAKGLIEEIDAVEVLLGEYEVGEGLAMARLPEEP